MTVRYQKQPDSVLLSLVVIFTQSIQLSKIMSEPYCYVVAITPSGGLSIPAQGSNTQPCAAYLNLKQT